MGEKGRSQHLTPCGRHYGQTHVGPNEIEAFAVSVAFITLQIPENLPTHILFTQSNALWHFITVPPRPEPLVSYAVPHGLESSIPFLISRIIFCLYGNGGHGRSHLNEHEW